MEIIKLRSRQVWNICPFCCTLGTPTIIQEIVCAIDGYHTWYHNIIYKFDKVNDLVNKMRI